MRLDFTFGDRKDEICQPKKKVGFCMKYPVILVQEGFVEYTRNTFTVAFGNYSDEGSDSNPFAYMFTALISGHINIRKILLEI